MAFGSRYSAYRAPLYIALWITSAILLGLTAYRIHSTRRLGYYDRRIAELLATSILTLLWVPVALVLLMRGVGRNTTNTNDATATTGTTARNFDAYSGRRSFAPEYIPWSVLWVMWLVGAAITTNRWPSRGFCGFGFQCRILSSTVGFAWLGFSLLTLIGIVGLMHHASLTGPENGHGAEHNAGYGGVAPANGHGAGQNAEYGGVAPATATAPGTAAPAMHTHNAGNGMRTEKPVTEIA